MSVRNCCAVLALAGLLAVSVLSSRPSAAEPAPAGGELVVVDAGGKEQKLKTWKFTAGTRHLAWLAPGKPAGEAPQKDGPAAEPAPARPKGRPAAAPRPAVGPEALEFRETNSTTFVDGVLTLVPLENVIALDYDEEKATAALRVSTAEAADKGETLTGATRFKGINKLTIEAEVDRGERGIAEVKFLGGVPKGVRGVRFPAAKALAAPKGRPASVTVADGKEKAVFTVFDLQPLYRLADGGERLLPTLMFRKTLKVDVGTVQKITVGEGKGEDAEWQVKGKDGEEETLTLLRTIPHEGGMATLEGLLGRVATGYKLFPPHTFTEIVFDEKKDEPKP